ncbi:MAG: Gfo/Idh/MocA family oxidoreductase, partial [Planctomycetes bacterium]|nr:Gfo/Idh/MocA family oxidoreductase [Planctomycetota bacterium]
MNEGPVRVALFGLGQWGNCHRAILEDCAREGTARLACAFTFSRERAEARARSLGIPVYHRGNWREIFDVPDGLDAVHVATPDPFHSEYVLAALGRGLNVYVEKPMATTVAECIEIAKVARGGGRLVEIGFHKRFDPSYKHAEVRLQAERVYDPPEDREIEGKPLGRILKGKATMEEPQLVPREWFRTWADRSSPAFYLGTHMYDTVRFLIRSEPCGVVAYGHRGLIRSRTRAAPTPDGVDTWDTVQAQVFFRNGASFYFDTSWILPDRGEYLTRQQVDIAGEDGIIDIDTCRRGFRSTTARLGPREDNPHFFKANLRDGRLVYEGYGVE